MYPVLVRRTRKALCSSGMREPAGTSHRGVTREAVAAAAADLVASDGLEALSVRQVANRLGVWPTTVPVTLLDLTCLTYRITLASASRETANVEYSPTTLGTVVCGLPVETTIVTSFPLFSFVPGCGLWRNTYVTGVVSLGAR